jgi:hypothetical protein
MDLIIHHKQAEKKELDDDGSGSGDDDVEVEEEEEGEEEEKPRYARGRRGQNQWRYVGLEEYATDAIRDLDEFWATSAELPRFLNMVGARHQYVLTPTAVAGIYMARDPGNRPVNAAILAATQVRVGGHVIFVGFDEETQTDTDVPPLDEWRANNGALLLSLFGK